MKPRRHIVQLAVGMVMAGLISPMLLVTLVPSLHARSVFAGALFAAVFLGFTALAAIAFRNSRDLSTVVMIAYLTKVSVVVGVLFLLPVSVTRDESLGWGVLVGAISYQFTLLYWYRKFTRESS